MRKLRALRTHSASEDRAVGTHLRIELKEFREFREFSEGLRAFGWGLKEFREFREFREGLRAFGRLSGSLTSLYSLNSLISLNHYIPTCTP